MNLPVMTPERITIFILTLFVLGCLLRIRLLRKELIKIRYKQLLPILTLEIDLNKVGIFLKNLTDYYAKDIEIEDVKLTLGYAFKKEVRLVFTPVILLRAHETVLLHCRLFTGNDPFNGTTAENLLAHIAGSSFIVHLQYANIENTRYHAIIVKEKDDISVKEVVPI